jgi:hypothetical protein
MLGNIILISIVLLQLGFAVFFLLLILYFSSALFVWPPSIPTDRKSRRYIAELIGRKYPPDAAIKIVDLGSGYGHLVRTLSKAFSRAEITGVELLRLPYIYSKFIFARNKRIKIIKGDIYHHDLSEYDVLVFFLRKDHKVDEKIKNEIKKGAIVVSNNFPLKTYEPKEIKEIADVFAKRTIYFYEF